MQDFRMRTFLTVCRTLSFTKAAEELHLTQPAVTQHIRFLETEYGVRLFARQGRKIQITAEGEILRKAALTMQHDELRLKDELQQVRNRRSYIFGATLSVAEYMLLGDLPRFIGYHPDDRIEMVTANTTELLDRLDAGRIDFAIVEGDFPKDEYESLLYRTERYVAAGSPKTAERLRGAGFADLLGERLITREEGSGTRDILERELAQRGLAVSQFAHVIELGSIGLIKRLVEAGLGITFLYHAAVVREEREGTLAIIAIPGFELEHEINFIFRKDSIFREDYGRIFHEFRDDGERRFGDS